MTADVELEEKSCVSALYISLRQVVNFRLL